MELEQQSGITVAELIDLLSEHPGDAVIEMAIIAEVKPGDEDITVDRYAVEGLMPWSEGDDDIGTVWMIGGEDEDVDTFLDAVEQNLG